MIQLSFYKKHYSALFSAYACSAVFSPIRKMIPSTETWHLVPLMQMTFFIVQKISEDVEFQMPRLLTHMYDCFFKDKAFLCKQ